MKKLFSTILLLLIALTACSAGEGTENEGTAELPTEAALAVVPTVTDTPTAEPTATDIPTATPTPEPEPTETAEPTATKEIQPAPPQEEAPTIASGTIPGQIQLPEGAVIVFTQAGGFAGLNDTWVFYPDGRVTLNREEQAQLTPERINDAIIEIQALGFFEITHRTVPGEFCCDFFDYTLAVQTQNSQNFVSFSGGDPDLPANLMEIVSIIRGLVEEAQQR